MKSSINSHILDPALQMFIDRAKKLTSEIIAIYLFGSRARKTFRPDSDYDLLIVSESKNIRDGLYDIAIDIFCETEADISLKIFSKEDFNKLKRLPTPFIENVLNEGIQIA